MPIIFQAGFMKVRHYGFMNANCAVTIRDLRQKVIACIRDLALLLSDKAQQPFPTHGKGHSAPVAVTGLFISSVSSPVCHAGEGRSNSLSLPTPRYFFRPRQRKGSSTSVFRKILIFQKSVSQQQRIFCSYFLAIQPMTTAILTVCPSILSS